MKNRIGIFGGTFNPPHIAHKIAAEYCREELSLEKIVFIPSGNHPLKNSIDAEHRYNMAVRAFCGDDNFEVSDIEVKNISTKSYTVDTLKELRENKFFGSRLVLIIGADNLLELHKWKDPHLLFELSEVVVMHRPGYEFAESESEFLKRVTIVEIPLLEISSTMIRDRMSKGLSVKYMIDPEVENYISEHGLYSRIQL